MKKTMILILLVAMTGCSYRVQPSDVAWAEKTCANRGGIRYMEPETGATYFIVVCNDNGRTLREERRQPVQ